MWSKKEVYVPVWLRTAKQIKKLQKMKRSFKSFNNSETKIKQEKVKNANCRTHLEEIKLFFKQARTNCSFIQINVKTE